MSVVRPPGKLTKIVGTPVTALAVDTYQSAVDRHRGKMVVQASWNDKGEHVLDVSWLRFASKAYNVSANPRDYVLVPAPVVTADIPNRNTYAFPYTELTRFDPYLGRTVWKTFVGKPTHVDHKEDTPKGVLFDALLVREPETGIWNVYVLHGFDQTVDPKLAEEISSGKRNAYSMGALVEVFACSICGQRVTKDTRCEHMTQPGQLVVTDPKQDPQVAYHLCYGVNFIESSSVDPPANPFAYGDTLLKPT